jgi:hypothetical protein
LSRYIYSDIRWRCVREHNLRWKNIADRTVFSRGWIQYLNVGICWRDDWFDFSRQCYSYWVDLWRNNN